MRSMWAKLNPTIYRTCFLLSSLVITIFSWIGGNRDHLGLRNLGEISVGYEKRTRQGCANLAFGVIDSDLVVAELNHRQVRLYGAIQERLPD